MNHMNIWTFINNFIFGALHGATFGWFPDEPTGGHPAFMTAWVVGTLTGLGFALAMVIIFLAPLG